MNEKTVKITILKFLYAILVFAIAVLVISRLSVDDNADMTVQMASATLPTVSFVSNGQEINPLHGYISEMDVAHIRGTVYPIGTGREINYRINTYGTDIDNLRFEVRNISGSSLNMSRNTV